MRRAVLALIPLLVALVATGCGGQSTTLAPVTAAPAQEARVGWVEPTSPETPRLVFGVQRIDVLTNGWRAVVTIRNETAIPWKLGDPRAASDLPFGVMLFATGDLDEVTRRDRERDLPGIRDARTVQPALPRTLEPGASWEGSIAAPGALAAGRWLRVQFGPLIAVGDPPQGLPQPLAWISDNAYLLRG
jgi:hypothetical protein